MKKISKVINISLSLIFISIALTIAYIAFPQFGNQALIVRSGSMEPTIDVGSIVVVREANAQSYRPGEVITFRSETNKNTLITHRITQVLTDNGSTSYKTKGDANEEEDGWIVNPSNIVGKVNFTLPYAGQFLAFVKSDVGFFTIIIIPATFVILLETWSIFKEIRRKRRHLKIDHPFEGFGTPPQNSVNSGSKWISIKVLIPLVAVIILLIPGTYAFMSDTETSSGNIFQAAAVFPGPSVTPSIGPSVTPSITPSITPAPSQQANIYISDPFTCSTGATDNTITKGTVTISKDSSLDVSVSITGALPSSSYDLWVNQDPNGCPLAVPTVAGFINTDSNGDGSGNLFNHAIVGGSTNYWISLVSGSDVLRSTAVGL